MAGTERPIIYHDAQGRARFSVGLLNGPVYECVNVGDSNISPGAPVVIRRDLGTIAPYLPAAADIDDPPPTVLATENMQAAGFNSYLPLGVAIDFIAKNGGVGRVAGQGCVVPVIVDTIYDTNGAYVVAGGTVGGAGLKATGVVGETIGFATTFEYSSPNASIVGVLVNPA